MSTLACTMRNPRRWTRALRMARVGRLLGRRHNRIRRLPPPLSAWTVSRDAPRPPTQSFRDWWTEQDRS
jgi:L-lactate dehydrogenase complex protein LldF